MNKKVRDFINFIIGKKENIVALFRNKFDSSVYRDFTPEDNIENSISVEALHLALKNQNIKNIALTGPYGAGKSSVILSYLRKYKKCKAINISLATFADNMKKEDKQDGNEKIDEILELGILKQLFYKVKASKIPLSRYRKLHHIPLIKYVMGVLLPCLVCLGFTYLIKSEIVQPYLDILTSQTRAKTIIDILISIFSIIGLAKIISWGSSKVTIKSISIGKASVQGEDKQKLSILDKNIDEILYFFEKTKYRVIFFEDLDRFNDSSIFIKLRELNKIINNYDVIRRPIVFVYAVKDDLFSDETERTKFFDFIIPIIPVINSTNSGEILLRLLGMSNKKDDRKDYPKHDISSHFVNSISPFIGDMRLLISTVNEFWMYKKTLIDSQHVWMKDENMFALMIYKNLNPKDFALLEAESGDIKIVFDKKIEIIDEIKAELEIQRNDLNNYLKDVADSVYEMKIILLNQLKYGNYITLIQWKNKKISRSDYFQDNFIIDNNIRNEDMIIYYREPGYLQSSYSSESLISIFPEYIKRYDILLSKRGKTEDTIRDEIQNLESDLQRLRSLSMKELIEKISDENKLPQELKENKLLTYLLRCGFIDENYSNYINYFHSDSITKNELNFILSVKNRTPLDYSYPILHCNNVCRRLEDYEFKQIEVLNFDIIDYLLEADQKNKDEVEEYFEIKKRLAVLLSKLVEFDNDTITLFLKQYIMRDKNVVYLISLLLQKSDQLWNEIYKDEISLNDIDKRKCFHIIIEYGEKEDIINNNSQGNYITKYLLENPDILDSLSDIDISKLSELFKVLLRGNGFSNLNIDNVKKELLDLIFDNNYYVINKNMIGNIFKFKKFSDMKNIFRCNYHCIKQLNYDRLLNRLGEEGDFKDYIENIIIKVESNRYEEKKDIEYMLEQLYTTDIILCQKLIMSQYKVLKYCDISEFINLPEDEIHKDSKQKIWDILINTNLVSSNWKNIMIYYNTFGITKPLLVFLNNNKNKLFHTNISSWMPSDNLVEKLIQTELDNDFKINLIKYANYKLTEERYNYLKKNSIDLAVMYAITYSSLFIEVLSQLNIEPIEVKEYLKCKEFSNHEKALIFNCLSLKDIDADLAMKLKDATYEIGQEYVEQAWKILKNKDKYELLLNHINVYDNNELEEKFIELGGDYIQLTKREKQHKYKIENTPFNQKLCQALRRKRYITSMNIYDNESKIEGFVKRIGKSA